MILMDHWFLFYLTLSNEFNGISTINILNVSQKSPMKQILEPIEIGIDFNPLFDAIVGVSSTTLKTQF